MHRSVLIGLGLFLFALLAVVPVRAQVCSGDISLTSQMEVNAFACNEVTGTLYIGGDDITDLSPLAELVSVGGELRIGFVSDGGNGVLESLTGLENLTSVGEHLFIEDNTVLETLSGLENLASVGGAVAIYLNPVLESLTGLENLDLPPKN